ncbi:MAG: DUF3089 domain-containing protein [Bacteroidota bacterium]|jgi:hypothetical protein
MKYTSVLCILTGFLFACNNGYHKYVSQYRLPEAAVVPDYSNIDYWAAHPYKKDPSDSIPKPLRKQYRPDSTIDVFFIHPTTYTDNARSFGWSAPIHNAQLAAKTDYSTILYQASIFNEAGRIFAPRYRQANLGAYFPVTAADTTAALAAFELAYTDVKNAFLYYLEHYNAGRPIIIATHSQGTTHGKRLVKEFFDGKALQQKLVAAYLVGIPVEENWFAQLKPCSNASETGCVLSWRTFKEGYKPAYVLNEKEKAIVTNPLTWNNGDSIASRYKNKGGIVTNFNRPVKRIAAAHNTNGVIWTHKPRFFGNIFFTTKNYHIGDYNLYYLSVRENVKERVKAYKNK